MDKRTFIKNSGLLGLGAFMSFDNLSDLIDSVSTVPSSALAKEEDFWLTIRKGYKLNPDYINFENGYYNFLPEQTLEKFIAHVREVNYLGSFYMRTYQAQRKAAMRDKLAELAGCTADELIITRNTTESLDIVIGGLEWKQGDEALMAEQDYPAVLNMFKLIAKRYGVENKMVSVPMNPSSDDEIVSLYENAITPRTKILHVSHMINITGQILPVRKICDMAHSKGVEVIVDGAHAFAHFMYKIPELNCDYYGSSLHKWLSVPLGAGILYVKKENISKVWPLIGPGEINPDNIARLNHIGTHPAHTDITIEDSIGYYNMLGGERKEARLRYLQNYWKDKVKELPHVILNTPSDPARSCGIGNVGVKSMKPGELGDLLLKKYKIFCAPIDGAGVHGCRITPNVYNTTAELDVLVKALKEL